MLEGRRILNHATVPDVQAMFIDQMKIYYFNIAAGMSNNQDLEKMNNHSMQILSQSSTVIDIFYTIDMGNCQNWYYSG